MMNFTRPGRPRRRPDVHDIWRPKAEYRVLAVAPPRTTLEEMKQVSGESERVGMVYSERIEGFDRAKYRPGGVARSA